MRHTLIGLMPCRDFHLFPQPLHPYIMAALNALLGCGFIIFRMCSIFERLFLVSMVCIKVEN